MSEDFPELIHHYTTIHGLLGIFKEKALWATKIHYLNDASELVRPFNIADNYLLDKIENTTEKDIIESMRYDIEISGGTNICVASFCANPDLLSQWRAYGDSDQTYSIGFRTEELIKSITKESFELRKCEYFTPASYKQHIEQFIQSYIEKVKEDTKKLDSFISELIMLASVMKYDYFREEDEYRVISTVPLMSTNDKFNFRAGKSILVPYYSIPLDLKANIARITIGPCQHPDLTSDTIYGLAYRYGLVNERINMASIDVNVTAIPYRHI
jgi:hypothetical protein